MAKKKYKRKPESWYCIQYIGTNVEELTEFCPLVTYDTNTQQLMWMGLNPIDVTSWVMQDNAGIFTVMIDEQFNAYFDLDTGPTQQPA
jgi:hypothetical protein